MRWFVLPAMLMLLSGCAHVFSDRAENMVNPRVTFAEVKQNPQAFVGTYVKVGGIIVETENTKSGSQIEVLQLGLSYDDIPYEDEGSYGRFLATTAEYLDPMIYKAGRRVAIIGEVTGARTMPLAKIDYTYPVIAITEIHLWEHAARYAYPPYPYAYPYGGPYFYYDPFFYPYGWYGSYWYPYGRHIRRR